MKIIRGITEFRCSIGLLLASLIVIGPVQAESYLYDAAGRLTRVTYADGSIAYDYDNNGNILRRYRFVTPPEDGDCSGLLVTISNREFRENVTCNASTSLSVDASRINSGFEVIFISPKTTLINGFSVQHGSIFAVKASAP